MIPGIPDLSDIASLIMDACPLTSDLSMLQEPTRSLEYCGDNQQLYRQLVRAWGIWFQNQGVDLHYPVHHFPNIRKHIGHDDWEMLINASSANIGSIDLVKIR